METKFRRLVMTAGAVLMTFWASAAFAQDVVHLGSGGSDQSWAGTSNTSLAGFWLDQGALSSGDDRKDLIIGAPGGSTQPGHAYVIFGGPVRTGDNLLSSADVIFNGGVGGDRFGTSTAAGNVISAIGSGPRDLVIGAPSANSGAGAVYMYRGGFTNNQVKNISDAAVTILGAAGDQLGTSLATADLNNDGYREIVIGAPGNGRVYVIDGAASLSGTIDLSTHSASSVITGTLIGYTMAAGDVDGDGIYDLLIGAPKKSSETGAVYLLKGRNGGLPTTVALDTNADAMFSGINPGDNAGSAIKLGDFDDDGHTDILIGADGADGPSGNVRGNAGSAYILWGGPGLTGKNLASADVTIYGAAAGDRLGTAANTGDVNRDTRTTSSWPRRARARVAARFTSSTAAPARNSATRWICRPPPTASSTAAPWTAPRPRPRSTRSPAKARATSSSAIPSRTRRATRITAACTSRSRRSSCRPRRYRSRHLPARRRASPSRSPIRAPAPFRGRCRATHRG